MPELSPGDLALLRTHPHKSEECLAVLHPATMLTCLLDGVPTGDPVTQISYSDIDEGDPLNVIAGMTLYVGTSEGGRQKGTCRIRKAPADSILYIAEDSKIEWEDDDYLTVVENYELWVKYPRLVVAGETLTIYKDWEQAYNGEHSNWPPVAILGPPDCQFIDPDTGLATCSFVGERSYAVAPGATIPGANYTWYFPDGTPEVSTDPGTEAAPIVVTWDAPGTYWVQLEVEDSNGKTHLGRRPVFIFDRTGTDAPYTRFKMGSRSGSIGQHGHQASFEVYGDADQAEFPDGALVVYFTQDGYGDTQQSIGGNFPFRSHIKFVGYIQRESTQKDPETSTVTFEAATINSLMAAREGFSCWIKTRGTATTWSDAVALTADRAALSLCRHHSTILDICDVIISGNTLYIKSQEFAAKTNLLQQLQTLYDDLFAHVACDKQGRLYFDLDPQMRPVSERDDIDVIVDLTHADWRDKLGLPRPQEPKTSFINLAGVAYPGYPHDVIPILSKAPGDAPAYGGSTREISGLILSTQADGNEKAGLALAADNNEFPQVSIPLAGHWDVFDIVPQEYVRLSLAAGDTKRGIVWTNQKLIPRQVNYRVEEGDSGRAIQVDIEVEKDSFGPAGVDGDYPTDVPPVTTTTTAPPPTPPPGGYEGEAGTVVAAHSEDGVYWSDFMGESWENRLAGAVLDLIWDPWWFTNERAGNHDPANCILWACGPGFIKVSPDAGETWTGRTPTDDPPNTWEDTTPPTATGVTYKQLHGDIYNLDVFYALVEWQEVDSGLDKWRGWVAKTLDNGLHWTWYELASFIGGPTYTFDWAGGPEGFTPVGETFWAQESIATWYDGVWPSCPDGGDGYWLANAVSPGGPWADWETYICLQYATKMSFDTVNWLYRQWGGLNVGGQRLEVYTSVNGVDWVQAYTTYWESDQPCPYASGAVPLVVADKYARFVVWGHGAFGHVPENAFFALTLTNLIAGTVQMRPLAFDLDMETGGKLYLTAWADDTLSLAARDSGDLTAIQTTTIGACSKAEMEDQTYQIVPRCIFLPGTSGFGDYVWVFGCWDDGAVKHLAYSSDGGATFDNKGSATWTIDHRLGALEVFYDNQTLMAVVNHAVNPALWQTINQGTTWANVKAAPFGVEFEAITRCTWAADELFIGANAAGAVMAAWIEAPYTGDWVDGTGDPSLPTASGEITAIIFVG